MPPSAPSPKAAVNGVQSLESKLLQNHNESIGGVKEINNGGSNSTELIIADNNSKTNICSSTA